MPERTKLKRALGLPMITFYGLGTIVGGGFYALVGKVAAEAGIHTPLAFFCSAAIALFSAFSFAELSSRFPYSAGEAHYVLQAFQRRWLSTVVGWMVIATGVVSAATLANAFAGFLESLTAFPEQQTIVWMVAGLGLVAAIGIAESVILATIITLIEIGGLLFVIASTAGLFWTSPERLEAIALPDSSGEWSGIFLGAYVAFYSFVGFEDMVNVAEEVKRPERNLPKAILLSLGLTALLYLCTTLGTVLAVPQQELVTSKSPLSLVAASNEAAASLTMIGMLAGVNGALVQIVMASRVAYGMAGKGQAPGVFRKVHRWTRTPLQATAAATLCTLVLALWFPLVPLAKTTSTILLAIYALVNLSLWKIKRGEPTPRKEGPCYPSWLPVTGFTVCLMFVLFEGLSTLSELLN